jgi:ADP-ribose pyrophosphatase YjhB (NUDIX family)
MADIKVVTSVVIPYRRGFIYVKSKKDGKWGLPGGKVEPFEDLKVAAPREVAEEAGVEILVRNIVGFWHFKSDRGSHILNTVYSGTVIEGSPVVVKPDEVEDVKVFSLENILELNDKGMIRNGIANVRPVECYRAGVIYPLDVIESLVNIQPRADYTIKVVTSVVIPDQGRFLYAKSNEDGKWYLPGGKVNPFENARVAASRVVAEKIGMEIGIRGIIGFWYYESEKGNPVLNAVYSGEIDEESNRAVARGIEDSLKFSLGEIRRLYREGRIRAGIANVRPVEDYILGRRFPLSMVDSFVE